MCISNLFISEAQSSLYVSHKQNLLCQRNKNLCKRKPQEQPVQPCSRTVWPRTDLFSENSDESNMTFSYYV